MYEERKMDCFDGSFVRKLVNGEWVDLLDEDLENGNGI